MNKNKYLICKCKENNFKTQNEIKISLLIKKINGYELFFSPILDSEFYSFENLTYKINNDNSIFIYYSKNIKNPDLEFFINERKFDFLINNFNLIKNNIYLLVKNKLVHFNINDKNIILNDKNIILKDKNESIESNQFLIINFENSFCFDWISNNNIKFYFGNLINSSNYHFPLECLFISYLSNNINNNLTKEIINSLIRDYLNKNSNIFKSVSNEFLIDYEDKSKDFFYKFINYERIEIISKLINFWDSWDLFSLSLLYLNILNSNTYNNSNTSNNSNTFLTENILLNINPEPKLRPLFFNSLERKD